MRDDAFSLLVRVKFDHIRYVATRTKYDLFLVFEELKS